MATLPVSFQTVLGLAKRGNQEAITRLWENFLPKLSIHVSRFAPLAIRDDILQEVYLKMVKDISMVTTDNEAEFAAWLRTIAQFTVADYLRTKHAKVTVSLERKMENGFDVVSPDDPTERIEIQERIDAAIDEINRMPTEKRRIIAGRINGQSHNMIASRLGKNVPAVRKIESRIRYTLRQKFPQILIAIFASAIALAGPCIFISNSRPGSILYPIKQIVQPAQDSSTPVPTPMPVWTPTQTPTPTPSPTPSPTPTQTPTPTTTPAPVQSDSGGGNSPPPISLPIQTSKHPIACIGNICA